MTWIAMRDPATSKLAPVASYGVPDDMLAGLARRFASNDTQQSGPQPGQTRRFGQSLAARPPGGSSEFPLQGTIRPT